ncbi:MAG TPA: glycosyltransferase, partial [Chitinophagaceae bacterium]
LGLAICEAMMLGVPVVGMATTELSSVIQNGVSGYVHTDIHYLVDKMKGLLQDKALAERLGQEGRRTAMERFPIQRFIAEWQSLFERVVAEHKHRPAPTRAAETNFVNP